MMKIGIICYPTIGGSGVIATELGHELAQRGFEVHFISYEEPFRLQYSAGKIFFHKVDIYRYGLFQYPDYALPLAVKIADLVRLHRLDLIHVHYAIPHATSAFLAGQLLGEERPKLVTTLHGTDITLVGKERSYYDLVRFSIEQSDAITAVSSSLRRETIDFFKIKKPINVISNFFTPKKIDSDEVDSLRRSYLQKNDKFILHASNYREVKRPKDLLNIFLLIREQVPSKLILLGRGEGLDWIRREVYKLDLAEQVIFAGEHRDIDLYAAAADLFLLPSSQESFGLAALEAMAYGTPVIAARVGGLPDLMGSLAETLLFEVGDVEKMAEYGINLLSNANQLKEMSQLCFDRSQEFRTERVINEYISLYQSLF